MKHIVFTGGGSGGHVVPNIALIEELRNDYKISYIGSKNGIEKELIKNIGIPYFEIPAGKLRRYLSKENIKDAFRVINGFIEARKIIKGIKPDLVFSKGGFVSVPVVIAAGLKRIPVVIHESDITPGLANKLSLPSASCVCISFPETKSNIKKKKIFLTGTPARRDLFNGDKNRGYDFTGFSSNKKTILVMGGSLGSESINNALRKNLKNLSKYQIVHLCGKGKLDNNLNNVENYKQYEYLEGEMKDIFAISDIVISRAGANSIFEFLLLEKPNVLVPLGKNASRGDQILNAASFERAGYSLVVNDKFIEGALIDAIEEVFVKSSEYISNMKNSDIKDGREKIIEVIKEHLK